MTQADFARLLEISQGQLSKFEKGLAIPGGELLIRLNDLFGVNIHWLLTGEGESSVPRSRKGH
jgi:transcriptional regulator with XRE-family HTH domain